MVSLEAPKTFGDLQRLMHGFVSFAICFALLLMIWHAQYIYFRRYALDDRMSFLLNAALLFVVAFYVYPLKFLSTLLINGITDTVRWMRRAMPFTRCSVRIGARSCRSTVPASSAST